MDEQKETKCVGVYSLITVKSLRKALCTLMNITFPCTKELRSWKAWTRRHMEQKINIVIKVRFWQCDVLKC